MLLTRKATTQTVPQSRLARGLPVQTMDRRAFLKRSASPWKASRGKGRASLYACRWPGRAGRQRGWR